MIRQPKDARYIHEGMLCVVTTDGMVTVLYLVVLSNVVASEIQYVYMKMMYVHMLYVLWILRVFPRQNVLQIQHGISVLYIIILSTAINVPFMYAY